jgi:hypothetical protein
MGHHNAPPSAQPECLTSQHQPAPAPAESGGHGLLAGLLAVPQASLDVGSAAYDPHVSASLGGDHLLSAAVDTGDLIGHATDTSGLDVPIFDDCGCHHGLLHI